MTGPYADWFHDRTWGLGLATVLELTPVERIVTPLQMIEVHAHARFGWVLVRDGALEAVEVDAAYREMIAHVPLLGRARDGARVMILGGGDGGVLSEVLRHPFVAEVALIEPDRALIDVAARHLGLGAAFDDPRVTVRLMTGEDALADARGARFDVVIVDGAELPLDAALAVLSPGGAAVDSDGVVLSRTGPRFLRRPPPTVRTETYQALSPFAPGGHLAFFLATEDGTSLAAPVRLHAGQHYDEAVHRAAFALPTWWRAEAAR